jgi:hypothetical protein
MGRIADARIRSSASTGRSLPEAQRFQRAHVPCRPVTRVSALQAEYRYMESAMAAVLVVLPYEGSRSGLATYLN